MFIWFHHLALRERITPDVQNILKYYFLLLLFGMNSLFAFVSAFCDVEVSQLVHVSILVRGNHSQPVSHVVLLQVLLREVLQVSLAHGRLGGHRDGVLVRGHRDGVA